MKQFSKQNFSNQEDIQIQVPTARLGIVIDLPAGIVEKDVRIRARLVGAFGSKTIIERMDLQTLFEIAAQSEGFYRVKERADGSKRIEGHVDIAKGGALALSNNTYISFDVSRADGGDILECEIYSIQHPNTVTTYLYYNPVTITQPLQMVPLDRATRLVLPVANISEIQLTYPTGNVTHTNKEIRLIGDMTNDLVYVLTKEVNGETFATYGYNANVIMEVQDPQSLQLATRMQVEAPLNSPQFNLYLVEEKTL
jgi:hypothetical protein